MEASAPQSVDNPGKSNIMPEDTFAPSTHKATRRVYYPELTLMRPHDCPPPMPMTSTSYPALSDISSMTSLPVSCSVEKYTRFPRRRHECVNMKFLASVSEVGEWDNSSLSCVLRHCIPDDESTAPSFFDKMEDESSFETEMKSVRKYSGFVADYVSLHHQEESLVESLSTYLNAGYGFDGEDSNSMLTDFNKFQEQEEFNDDRYIDVQRNQAGDEYYYQPHDDFKYRSDIGDRFIESRYNQDSRGPHENEAPGEFEFVHYYDDDDSSMYDEDEDNLFNEELHDASVSLISNLTFDTAIVLKDEPVNSEAFDNEFGLILSAAEKERVSYLNDLEQEAERSNWQNEESDIMDLYSIAEEGNTSTPSTLQKNDILVSRTILSRAREDDELFRRQNRANIRAVRNVEEDRIEGISTIVGRKGTKTKGKAQKSSSLSSRWVTGTACRKYNLNFTGTRSEIPGESSMRAYAIENEVQPRDETSIDSRQDLCQYPFISPNWSHLYDM